MKSLIAKAANLVNKAVDGHQAHAAPSAHTGRSEWPRKTDPVLDNLLRDFRSAKLRRDFFNHDVKEYTETLDVKVLAGTYNVAGKKPPPGLKLHDWLDQWRDCWPKPSNTTPSAAAAGASSGPDIVVIGFQEVVPLSAGNVIAGPSSDGADAWDYALASTLNGEEWATRNFGRTYGSSAASQAMYLNLEKLGSQAAYAYSVISNQAANVVGVMDKMWSGANGDSNGQLQQQGLPSLAGASEQQQQARLAMALSDPGDSEGVYIQVTCKQLVGVYLSVWARKRIARHIRGVQATTAATGFGGYLGNKGAVAVRMRVYDAALVVVCSHLASGDQDGDEQKRNNDVAEIMRRCTFASTDPLAADPATQQQQPASAGHWGSNAHIMDHDNVIWMGDLNYRLVCGDEEARRYIRAGKLEALLNHDQLTREMAAGRVFKGWREGPISFNPTYKYHLGCNVYSGEPVPPGIAAVRAVDSSASLADSVEAEESGVHGGRDSPAGVEKQKKRTPAWCDRVLWLPGRQLYQLAYGRGEIAVSDHRPVTAAFLFEAHRYDRDAVQQLAESARRAVDMSDNAARPKCTLSPNFIEMQLVPYGTPINFSVKLSNIGSCPARYYFVPPPKPRMSNDGLMSWDDNQPICPPWLMIGPVEGEVQEGCTANITLTAFINGGGPNSAAAHLAANPAKPPAPINTLDTILILRLEDGADSFISIHGAFLPSCFAMDLDALLTLGSSPVLAVESLGEAGEKLLQQGLARPEGLTGLGQQAEAEADLLGMQVGELGITSSSSAVAAAGCTVSPSGVEDRVPKEVQRLVSFLRADQRLLAPGLFISSIQACLGSSAAQDRSSSTSSSRLQQLRNPAQLQQVLAATAPVRWALDTGLDFPSHVSAHQAAAALLLMLQQLPDSFMPADVSAILMHCVPPPTSCTSLLSDAMSVAEWATLRHLVSLFRAALLPEASAANGLSLYALSAALADVMFGGPAAVPAELVGNRVAFLMALLDPEAAAQQQQTEALVAAAAAPAVAAVAVEAIQSAVAAAPQQEQDEDSLL